MIEEEFDIRLIDFSELSNEDALELLEASKIIALKDLYSGLLLWGIIEVHKIENLDELHHFLFDPESLAAVEYYNSFKELGYDKAYYNMRDSYDKLTFIESVVKELS